jgi:hypothetical protein
LCTAGFSGCVESSESSDHDAGTEDEVSPTSTPTRTPTRETLHDELIFTDKRWPHEFEAGTMLYVEFDVIEGGPATFVFNETEYEGDIENISFHIKTEKTTSYEIKTSGLTYLEAIPRGEAEVLVEVEGF